MNIAEIAEELSLEEGDCLEIMELFLETGMDDIRKLACAIERGDMKQAAMAAHAVKGASANLRLLDLSEMARQIEVSIHREQWHDRCQETLHLLQVGMISFADDLFRQREPSPLFGRLNQPPRIGI
ncbi:MAG: Hpt domain-containing protein [Deltaproteobacteria bacterium]|nr:Hpt domain-containing protein [Deltaproteobacteria bacterium]